VSDGRMGEGCIQLVGGTEWGISLMRIFLLSCHHGRESVQLLSTSKHEAESILLTTSSHSVYQSVTDLCVQKLQKPIRNNGCSFCSCPKSLA
jgi:hypothetical protein